MKKSKLIHCNRCGNWHPEDKIGKYSRDPATDCLMQNHAIGLSECIARARLDRAGVTLGEGLEDLQPGGTLEELCKKYGHSITTIKRLAGG